MPWASGAISSSARRAGSAWRRSTSAAQRSRARQRGLWVGRSREQLAHAFEDLVEVRREAREGELEPLGLGPQLEGGAARVEPGVERPALERLRASAAQRLAQHRDQARPVGGLVGPARPERDPAVDQGRVALDQHQELAAPRKRPAIDLRSDVRRQGRGRDLARVARGRLLRERREEDGDEPCEARAGHRCSSGDSVTTVRPPTPK